VSGLIVDAGPVNSPVLVSVGTPGLAGAAGNPDLISDVFFQNELAYDVPGQAAWNESATFSGYPAFQAGAGMRTFQGYGMGSYVVFIDTTATLHVTEAFQAPRAAGVQFHDVFGLWIGGSGGLDSIANGTGGSATNTTDANNAPADVVSYPDRALLTAPY